MLEDMFTLRIRSPEPIYLWLLFGLTNSRIDENDMRELKISPNLGLIIFLRSNLRSDKSREKTICVLTTNCNLLQYLRLIMVLFSAHGDFILIDFRNLEMRNQ